MYLFGLTQLAADKRKKPPEGGKVAYFLGFGSYRVSLVALRPRNTTTFVAMMW